MAIKVLRAGEDLSNERFVAFRWSNARAQLSELEVTVELTNDEADLFRQLAADSVALVPNGTTTDIPEDADLPGLLNFLFERRWAEVPDTVFAWRIGRVAAVTEESNGFSLRCEAERWGA